MDVKKREKDRKRRKTEKGMDGSKTRRKGGIRGKMGEKKDKVRVKTE